MGQNHHDLVKIYLHGFSYVMGQRGLSWEGDEFTKDEHDICRLWLLSKTYVISGGSSEIQLNIIAKRVLGLPG